MLIRVLIAIILITANAYACNPGMEISQYQNCQGKQDLIDNSNEYIKMEIELQKQMLELQRQQIEINDKEIEKGEDNEDIKTEDPQSVWHQRI